MKKLDLTGRIFGRLSVIKEAPRGDFDKVHWLCRCVCGNETAVVGPSLKCGGTKSCGCLSLELKKSRIKHGRARVKDHSPEYDIWASMWQRCRDEDDPRYGGRNISVCDRWKDFRLFLEDMGKRPSPKHSIDRIKNWLGYSKDNCQWATASVQQRNKRSNRHIEIDGRRLLLIEAAERYGVPYKRLWHRVVVADWPIERAIVP